MKDLGELHQFLVCMFSDVVMDFYFLSDSTCLIFLIALGWQSASRAPLRSTPTRRLLQQMAPVCLTPQIFAVSLEPYNT